MKVPSAAKPTKTKSEALRRNGGRARDEARASSLRSLSFPSDDSLVCIVRVFPERISSP